jgi:hypothetical protein
MVNHRGQYPPKPPPPRPLSCATNTRTESAWSAFKRGVQYVATVFFAAIAILTTVWAFAVLMLSLELVH